MPNFLTALAQLCTLVSRAASRALALIFAIVIRVAAVLAIFLLPLALAGFAEWSVRPGDWSVISRAVVAVIWLATIALFIGAAMSGPAPGVRKA